MKMINISETILFNQLRLISLIFDSNIIFILLIVC